jgi:hypothetical protein
MKNLLKTFFLLLCFISLNHLSQAQSETTKKNLLKVNLLSPLLRTGSFFYERTLSSNSSLMLGLFYTGFSVDDVSFSGFGLTPAYRYYLSSTKQAPIGFYVSPYGRFMRFSLANNLTKDKGTLTTYGLGLELGYQWVFKDIISLNVFGGIGYSAGTFTATDNSNIDNLNGSGVGVDISRLLGLSLGVAF